MCCIWLTPGGVSSLKAQNDTPHHLTLRALRKSAVEIGRAPRAQHFGVWIADTAARQTQGLMFVRDLPADRGMLFIEQEARPMTFWMKNTPARASRFAWCCTLLLTWGFSATSSAQNTAPIDLATLPEDRS